MRIAATTAHCATQRTAAGFLPPSYPSPPESRVSVRALSCYRSDSRSQFVSREGRDLKDQDPPIPAPSCTGPSTDAITLPPLQDIRHHNNPGASFSPPANLFQPPIPWADRKQGPPALSFGYRNLKVCSVTAARQPES
jgi:hypothetical protein